jgi:hypothetical protein
MRPLPIVLLPVALLTAACSATIKEPHLDHQGSVDTETEGVILYEHRAGGFAGMSGTTCEFDRSGGLGTDVYVGGVSKPEVLDGDGSGGEDVVLVRTRDQLHVIHGDGWSMFPTATMDFRGVEQAFLTRDGIVGIGACALRWIAPNGASRHDVRLEGDRCAEAELTVDRDSGTAFVTAGGEVVRVDRRGHAAIGHQADGVLFSAALDGLVLTDAGSSELRAVTADGDLLWTMGLDPDLRGTTVHDVADMGTSGLIAVTTGGAEARLVLVDALTGEIVVDHGLAAATDVVAAADGRSLGLVLSNRVELYAVR